MATAVLLACLIAPLGGCATAVAGAAGLSVKARPLAPPGSGPERGSAVAPARIGELELLAAYELEGSTRTFGGLSALLLDGDDGLLLLSDRGRLFRARRVEGAATGRLDGLDEWAELRLPKAARRADTEALSRSADGGLVLGAEGERRLFRLTADKRAVPPLDLPDFLQSLPQNEGVEALATLPGGRLLAISEGAFVGPDLVTAGYLGGEAAAEATVRAPDGFRPTGADVAGDTLFLLQRRLSLLGGLEARLVALPLGSVPPDGGELPAGRELARLGVGSFAENFEGVAARRAPDGRYLIYLVADDNFSPLQRTLLLQLAWRPPAATAGR